MMHSMVRSMVSSSVSSTLKSSAATRYLSELNGTTSYYLIGAPIVYTGDYESEHMFTFDGVTSKSIFGDGSSFNCRLTINTSGGGNWRPDNSGDTGISIPNGSVTFIGLNTIKVTRVGAVGKVYVNGTEVVSGTAATGATLISTLGWMGGTYNDGILGGSSFTDTSGAPVTTTFLLNSNPGATSEASVEFNNSISILNIPAASTELFQLGAGQWDNISPPTQALPASINIATQA